MRPARAYPATILALLLVTVVLVGPADADPVVTDEGGGVKRATWDFATAGDYVGSNVTVSPGDVSLAIRSGARNYTGDAAFLAAQDAVDRTVVSSGVRLVGNPANLVGDGGFNLSAGPWTFSNSTNGHVISAWDAGRARFSHSDPRSQFDSMDDVVGSGWGVAQSVGVVAGIFQDSVTFVEGTGSLRLALDYTGNPAGFGGASRDQAGTWDLSASNRLAVWINANATGLRAHVHLQNPVGANMWPSADQPIATGWNRYVFDYSGFPGNPAAIDILQVRFTRTSGLVFTAHVDDLVLFNYTAFDEAASVSQTFSKPSPTSSLPGALVLTFDVEATASAFLTSYAQVSVGGSVHWSESPVAVGTRSLYVDLSADPILQGSGSFPIAFSLQLTRLPGQESSMTMWLDNVRVTAIDHRNGSFTALPIDAGSPANWRTATLGRTTPGGTNVAVSTRTGPDGVSWSPWQATAGTAIPSPAGRFLQWRLDLTTTNGSRTPIATWLDLRWDAHAPAGTVRTNAFLPPEPLVGWRTFLASDALPPGTSVAYEVSFDGGANWTAVVGGQDLSAAPLSAATVRATLATADTSVTPSLASVALRYEYYGPLSAISVSPPSLVLTADDAANFTATAIDEWGHALTTFGCIWRTNDPWGSVTGNGTLTGTYAAGRAGTWQVRCENSDGSIVGTATVTVTPGAVARIVVRPPTVLVPVAQTVGFTAEGEDADGNVVAVTSTQWSTTIGQLVAQNATAATLKAPPVPGSGTVTARQGPASGTATVFVTPEGTPRLNGTVPEQAADEDAPPWRLDLTRFAENQPDPNDTLPNLKWYLTGVDPALYSVFGEHTFGRHDLWFTPRRDAFGVNAVRLWLEDRDGARAFQDLTVRIRPINDPPEWTVVPTIHVKAGEARTFDFLPYVRDVDSPTSALSITADDPANIRTERLNATYNYSQSFLGRTLFVRHHVSDGPTSTTAIVTIRVSDNPPPQIKAPLPDLALDEDTVLRDAFPESLRFYFDDPRGEVLFFSYNFTNLLVWINESGGKVRVDVAGIRDFCGPDRITFRATDPQGAYAEYTVRVAVRCVNDPPVLAWTDDVHVQFDRAYRLDLTPFVRDVDNPTDELTLSTSDPESAAVDRFAITFLYMRYRLGTAPTYAVPLDLVLADPAASTTVRITVRVSDNRPPELIAPIPDQQLLEDVPKLGAIDLRQHFADVDNLPLAYAATGTNVVPSIAAALVTLSPATDWFGQEFLVFRATDRAGAFAIAHARVEVLPVNDRPVLKPLPPQRGTAGQTWILDLRPFVSDVDDDLSRLTFRTDHPRVEAVGFLLLFNFTSAVTTDVVVTVSDGTDETAANLRVTVDSTADLGAFLWPWSAIALFAALAGAYLAWSRLSHRYSIEDVFLISREGRLILHTTRRLRADRDEDILAGMLTAIMHFVRDSFREEKEDLKRFEFGDRKVAVERSAHLIGATIFAGEVPHGMSIHLKNFLDDVEERYRSAVARWSGDLDDLPGLRDMMEEFGRTGRWRAGAIGRRAEGPRRVRRTARPRVLADDPAAAAARDGRATFNCPVCLEEVPSTSTECWNCGAKFGENVRRPR